MGVAARSSARQPPRASRGEPALWILDEDRVEGLVVKSALVARIESAAENRDAGNPPTVADTQSSGYGWPGGYPGGGPF